MGIEVNMGESILTEGHLTSCKMIKSLIVVLITMEVVCSFKCRDIPEMDCRRMALYIKLRCKTSAAIVKAVLECNRGQRKEIIACVQEYCPQASKKSED